MAEAKEQQFVRAAREGNNLTVKELLSQISNINFQDDDGRTGLLYILTYLMQ